MTVVETNLFKRDRKRMVNRGKPFVKLGAIVALIAARQPLPPQHRDHPLTGNYGGYRECHSEPDWLLVYRLFGGTLELYRTGTHSDLF
ncbi:hypothetical protein FACS1894139_08980 [Planctomycetales bacterium]|nr:hypothetical protein FACS1894107_11970 [Planctomycetales bacterium]GHS98149.1 hypothetical protein FACS1894108_05770 [Planctomycetales bacterium]GHT05340.1 hypothetical protein FACS1894139_08980 [Planctomycetales bacterium]